MLREDNAYDLASKARHFLYKFAVEPRCLKLNKLTFKAYRHHFSPGFGRTLEGVSKAINRRKVDVCPKLLEPESPYYLSMCQLMVNLSV